MNFPWKVRMAKLHTRSRAAASTAGPPGQRRRIDDRPTGF